VDVVSRTISKLISVIKELCHVILSLALAFSLHLDFSGLLAPGNQVPVFEQKNVYLHGEVHARAEYPKLGDNGEY
jgi:hypothetical protein